MNLSVFFPFDKLTAGDTWKWAINLSNYPASNGWILTYTAKKEGLPKQTFSSTANGDSFSINVNASITQTFTVPGRYIFFVSLISPDGEITTLGYKTINILPDISIVNDAYDPRSNNQKCYDALEAVLYKNADRDVLETIFKDATFKYRSNSELIRLLNYYKVAIDSENGIKSGRIIMNRI